jgi:glycogen operon protein
MARNFLATLAFSQGIPMLSHGDEVGRTQRGNNNGYCHDGRLTWVDWDLDARERELLVFARKVLEIRKNNPVLRRRSFFSGLPLAGGNGKDVTWLKPDGSEFTVDDWHDPECRALGMFVLGEAHDEVDERGRPVQGDSLLLLLNAGERPCHFRLPQPPAPGAWEQTVNTARPGVRKIRRDSLNLQAHSLILLIYAGPA